MSGVPNLKYKTSICNAWKQGLPCQKGNFCFFAHGQQQLRSISFLAQQNANLMPLTSCKYKTTYCKFYSKGDCKLGQSCTFAHNRNEKRQKNYVPKQQIIEDPNFYGQQYYQGYTGMYDYNIQEGYPIYQNFSPVQAEINPIGQKKSQQKQQSEQKQQEKNMLKQQSVSQMDSQPK